MSMPVVKSIDIQIDCQGYGSINFKRSVKKYQIDM